MAIALGVDPEPLVVRMTTGADFKTTLTSNPAWPGSTTISLVFGSIASPTATYNATIAGADATWNVDKATSDLRPNGEWVCLRYVNGTDDIILAVGKVVRRG